jgi:hypothetical protein
MQTLAQNVVAADPPAQLGDSRLERPRGVLGGFVALLGSGDLRLEPLNGRCDLGARCVVPE